MKIIVGFSVFVLISLSLQFAAQGTQNKYAPILGEYVFDLGEEGGGKVLLKFHFLEGHLWGASPDGDEFKFAPVENQAFTFEGEDEFLGAVKATFLKDDQGEYNICHLVIEGLEIDVKGTRLEPGAGSGAEAPPKTAAVDESQPENATGTFTFNGKSVNIRHGFAWYEPSILDDSVTNIHLMFTDNPVHAGSRGSFDLRDLGRTGKIHGLMAAFATGGQFKNSIVSGSVYHEDIEEPNLSFSGGSLDIKITNLDDFFVEGRLFTTKEMKLFDYTMEVDVAFKVELPEKK
jgi:hypothetical protein